MHTRNDIVFLVILKKIKLISQKADKPITVWGW